jgi:exopolysaccharide biosynthesis polyprenyl glycosylphosphotransferase
LNERVADWRRGYSRRLIVSDLIVVVVAVVGSHAIWSAVADAPLLYHGSGFITSLWVVVVVVLSWSALLASFATRERRYLGEGSTEYRAVVEASLQLLFFFLIIIFVAQLDVGRGALLTAFFSGILGLLVERSLWRKWLVRQRRAGHMGSRVLLAGSASSVAHLAGELQRNRESGYVIVGACVHPGEKLGELERIGVPVIGDLDNIKDVMERFDADTLAIASSGRLPPKKVREISWQLEPGRQHLVVAPSLTDVGGPRIRMRPVAGLPLIHVETPRFERGQKAGKRTVDIVASGLGLLVLSPLLLAIAIAIRLGSDGPVFFRQTRVGLDGELFTMLKFRSMVTDAEASLAMLADIHREEGNSVLFKMRNDPRVTKIGVHLRRYSLDELPQLINVLLGSMSLIGPRPPLEREVAEYETHVHRRFLMKPGITGLWQVSGRSDLSWEDSVRLDLYYVENWSAVGDLVILWKTARAVLRSEGAY